MVEGGERGGVERVVVVMVVVVDEGDCGCKGDGGWGGEGVDSTW